VFDLDLKVYRNSEDALSVLSVFLLLLDEPTQALAPKFFDVFQLFFVPVPNVSIFDPTKTSNSLSKECLLPCPIPKSNLQRYPRNIYRGLRQSPFLCILKGDVPANARFPHPSGLLAHQAATHLVL